MKPSSSNELHPLDPADLERLHRRRASNIRMQNIIKTKILIPMADVVRQPSLSDSKRPSFESSSKSLATNAKEGLSNGESIQLQNFGSTDQKPDEPLSASGRRFANIAKSITLLSGRSSRVGDSSLANPDAQEQNAFFNKYGMGNQQTNTSAENVNPETVAHISRVKKMKLWFIFAWRELVIDSSTDSYYYWLGVISFAYLYNLLLVIFRCVFFDQNLPFHWTIFFVITDIFCDMLYIGDIYVRSRTGYLEQGLLVKDVAKIVKAYKKTYTAYFDFISVFPADYLLEAILRTPRPYLRFNRLIKLDRIQAFISATETRIAAPNAFRIFCVISYIVVLIHWNGCIYFFVSNEIVGRDSDQWVYVEDTLFRRYVYSFYWSMLILTTIGEVPYPVENIEFVFVTLDLMCGVLIFATIVGNVGR
uniref:Ion transport domain-containing protein n=1 Tax=Panagrolaimus davidi TaxID=227884 RepID=A0A914QZG9_9BILA